jgi:rRNA pseudouridine-1189 N-methylase Emg1 (Nep1/Mra1 family)
MTKADMLKNPNNNTRVAGFSLLLSAIIETRNIPVEEQEEKRLIQMMSNGLIDMLEDADIDLQVIILSSFRSSFRKIFQLGESQTKPLRDVLISLQKSPHRQIRDIARTYLDELKHPEY